MGFYVSFPFKLCRSFKRASYVLALSEDYFLDRCSINSRRTRFSGYCTQAVCRYTLSYHKPSIIQITVKNEKTNVCLCWPTCENEGCRRYHIRVCFICKNATAVSAMDSRRWGSYLCI